MATSNSISQHKDVRDLLIDVYDTISLAHENLDLLYTLFEQIDLDSSEEETLGITNFGKFLADDFCDLLGGMHESAERNLNSVTAEHPEALAPINLALSDALAIAKEACNHHNDLKSMFSCISRTWKKWPESSCEGIKEHRRKAIGNLCGMVEYRANQLMQVVKDNVEVVAAIRA